MHSLPSPSALQMIGVSKKMVDAKKFFFLPSNYFF